MLTVLAVALVVVWTQVAATGEFGWDTSQVKDQKIIDCLEDTNNAQFIAFSAMSFNNIDPDVCSELSMAKVSNIPKRDVTFTPCPTCANSADDQLSKAVQNLNNHCSDAWSGRVWLDMKSYSVWPTPWHPVGYQSNQKFFADVVDSCMGTKNATCGVLSSPDAWKWILGSPTYTYAPATTLPLWYSSLSGVPSFDDFVPFGGYTKPFGKQYVYMLGECGASVIYQDWSPEW